MVFKKTIFALTIIVVITIVIAIIALNTMTNNILSMPTLEKWISRLEIASYVAVAFTILFGGISIYLKSQLTDLQKKEADRQKIEIAHSNERAEVAIAQQKRLDSTILALKIELKKVSRSATEANKGVQETKSKIKTRHLTEQQRKDLTELLLNVPHQSIEFGYISGDKESYDFCKELDSVFEKSSWGIDGTIARAGSEITGINIIVKSLEEAPAHAKYIQDALSTIGYPASGSIDNTIEPKKMIIFVGHKP